MARKPLFQIEGERELEKAPRIAKEVRRLAAKHRTLKR